MDIFYLRKKKPVIAGAVTLICCLLMVMFPETALISARKGMTLWFKDVFPALMPFFICANFLNNIGIMRFLKSGVFPFAMSVLSGYPMGAKIVGDLKRNGEISIDETKRLMSFCSTSGPAFIIGTVGAGMLESGTAGAIIAFAHYGGALINGAIYTRIYGKNNNCIHAEAVIYEHSIQGVFTESILSAFRSLGIILAYIVLFTLAADFINMSGALNFINSDEIIALIKGFMEMTVGCEAASALTSNVTRCVLCTVIISWGGLSILAQTMSMLAGTGVSTLYIIISKISHSFISGLIALISGYFVL